jgi:hypothetical protein
MKTTAQRLQQYRDEAESPKWIWPLTWRDTKQHHASAWGAPRANNVRGPEGQIYSEQLDQYGADLGPAGKLFPRLIDHNGWYADNYQDALIVGHVCRMRCPRGTLYIPATRNTDCDGTVHYINDAELVPRGATEDDHDKACREAARSADHYAEKEAEDCREDNAKYMAEADIEAARAEIHRGNAEALALIREIKQQRRPPFADAFTPAICTALRNQVTNYLHARAKQFAIIREREADYWTAAPGY